MQRRRGSSLAAHRFVRANLPWVIASLVMVGSWVYGIFVWGTPLTGFQPTDGLYWMFFMALAFPVVLVGAALRRRSRRYVRVAGAVLTVAALIWTAYMAHLSHFGGFCGTSPTSASSAGTGGSQR